MNNKIIEKLKLEIDRMYAIQDSFLEHGAGDSEPSGVVQVQIRRAFWTDKEFEDLTCKTWSLYGDTPASVVRKMNSGMKRLYKFVQKHSDSVSVGKYLEGFCWRIDWNKLKDNNVI